MDFKSFLEYTAAKNNEVVSIGESVKKVENLITHTMNYDHDSIIKHVARNKTIYDKTTHNHVSKIKHHLSKGNTEKANDHVDYLNNHLHKKHKIERHIHESASKEIISEHDFEVGDKVTIKASNKQGKVVKIDNYGTEDEVYHVKVDDNIYKQDPKSLKENMDLSQCLKFAAQSLEEEEQAIKDYTDRIKKCADEGLKKILSHALEEERHHAKMIRDWINKRSGE